MGTPSRGPTPPPDQRFVRAVTDGKFSFRDLIEQTADGMLVVDGEGRICFVNPAAVALLGRDAEDLLGQPFGTPVVPGEITEVDVLRAGGEVRVAELRAAEVRWGDGTASVATLRDITDRKRAEESLRFLAEVSRELVGTLDASALDRVARLVVPRLADYCLIDMAGEDGALRPVALAHHEAGQEERLRAWRRRHPPAPATDGLLYHVLHDGRARSFPAPTGGAAGPAAEHPRVLRQFGFQAFACVPLVVRGHAQGVMTLARTRPGRCYDADALALAHEVACRAALAADSARLYDASREAVRQRDQFLAMLAHELRNPLAPILHAAELLDRHADDPAVLRRTRTVVERQARQMARLLDDLLDVSRVTHGKIELRRRPVALADVVADSVQAALPHLQARGHQLATALPDEPLWLDADPARLEQVLVNLLTNAAKYTPPGGRVELGVHRDADQAVVRVRDTGIGMAPDVLPHVFELFRQAEHRLDGGPSGLGIGLTLVRSLVEMHGGRVSATSPGLGLGSEFEVRLPLTAAPAVGPTAPGSDRPAGGCRVLLVEDSPDSREMLRDLLELDGHEVDTAADGCRGLELLATGRYEVALIDINLPGLDGYQIARRLQGRPARADVCLVALTGYGQANDRRRALEAGFDVHLVKPVDLAELNRLLAAPRPQPAGEPAT